MFVVAAEIMGASEGVGYLLPDGRQVGKPDQIIAAILVFAVLGQGADAPLKLCSAPALAGPRARAAVMPIEADALAKTYADGARALQDVSLSFAPRLPRSDPRDR